MQRRSVAKGGASSDPGACLVQSVAVTLIGGCWATELQEGRAPWFRWQTGRQGPDWRVTRTDRVLVGEDLPSSAGSSGWEHLSQGALVLGFEPGSALRRGQRCLIRACGQLLPKPQRFLVTQ